MKIDRTILLALAAAVAIPGCKGEPADERYLTVTGPLHNVERFVAAEAAREPPLPSLRVRKLPEGRAQARLTVPAAYDGADVVRMTRAALAADLGYRLEIRHKP